MEKYLEQNYIDKTNAQMAEHLSCSVVTVARRLRKMGLNRMNIKYFVDKAKRIHGNRYDYSKSEYVNYPAAKDGGASYPTNSPLKAGLTSGQ